MWHLYAEPSGSWLPGLPVGGGKFFQLYRTEELLRLVTSIYVVTGTAHFKQHHFKWRNKYLIMLMVATAGTVDDIEPLVSVLRNTCFFQDLTGGVLIQKAIYFFEHLLAAMAPRKAVCLNTGHHVICAVHHIGVLHHIHP